MNKSMLLACAMVVLTLAAFAKPAFCLPERIYAAPGLELNVYYKAIFDSVVPQNYAYRATCPKGRAESKRWAFTPTKDDAGKTYRLVITAWNDDGCVAAVTSQVVVAAAPADPKRRITLALFGDSLTNCGYQDQILRNMRAAGYVGYTPVGSRSFTPEGAKHDGYGGYGFESFLTRYQVSDEEIAHVQDKAERDQLAALGVPVKIVHDWQRDLLRSPLVKFENGRKSVDVRRWLGKVNGGHAPDVVLVELGINDVFFCEGEIPELRAHFRKTLLPKAERLLGRLREDMPEATYLVCTMPVGSSQDGFGRDYGAGPSEVQHRKIIFAMNREYEAWVKEADDPKLLLLPVGHAVDPEGASLVESVPESARSTNRVVRSVNAVHPSDVGGGQMGDAIAAMLMSLKLSVREDVEIVWRRPICKEPGRYIGWPTVCARSNGEIVSVFSGDRDQHVCPWGKVQLVRSADGGETWSKPETIQNGILDDRDAGIVELKDGTLVLNWFTSIAYGVWNKAAPEDRGTLSQYRRHYLSLPHEQVRAALGSWVSRSTDGGKTWSTPVRTPGQLPHGVTVLRDGRLVAVARKMSGEGQVLADEPGFSEIGHHILCMESSDGGRSWRQVSELQPEEGVKTEDLHEPHLAELPDGRLVAQVRWHGSPRPGVWGGIVQAESADGGRTWTKMKKTPLVGFPPHLIVLKDGRLLTVYGNRNKGMYGEYACLSSDGGRTWDVGREICLAPYHCGDLGYPASAQLPDGAILTVYYQAAKKGEPPCLMATKWRLK